MKTHGLQLPSRVDRLTTYCGIKGERAPAGALVATDLSLVNCPGCIEMMESALAALQKWQDGRPATK